MHHRSTAAEQSGDLSQALPLLVHPSCFSTLAGLQRMLPPGVHAALSGLGHARRVRESDEAKKAVREAKLDDNQSALLQVAAQPSIKAQLAEDLQPAQERRCSGS
jgi:hypothetical protein